MFCFVYLLPYKYKNFKGTENAMNISVNGLPNIATFPSVIILTKCYYVNYQILKQLFMASGLLTGRANYEATFIRIIIPHMVYYVLEKTTQATAIHSQESQQRWEADMILNNKHTCYCKYTCIQKYITRIRTIKINQLVPPCDIKMRNSSGKLVVLS